MIRSYSYSSLVAPETRLHGVTVHAIDATGIARITNHESCVEIGGTDIRCLFFGVTVGTALPNSLTARNGMKK